MRALALPLFAAALGSCAMAPSPPPMRSAMQQGELNSLLAGKVAQAPVTCLPTYLSNDMRVIDENTVVYRNGAKRVYVGHFNGGCNYLGEPGYALLTKPFGSGSCRGDIAQVIDTHSGFTVGSCVVGDFTPFVAS